mgnify:FL=1
MTRVYRGVKCHLTVGKLPCENARVKAAVVDGEKIEGNYIPFAKIEGKEKVEITVEF